MVTINRIHDVTCELYYKDKLIGKIENQLEFNDVRIQIKKEHADGYAFKFQGKMIEVFEDGTVRQPKGFYDQILKQLSELIEPM